MGLSLKLSSALCALAKVEKQTQKLMSNALLKL